MDQRGIAGRQFGAELADLKKRVDKLERASRGRRGIAAFKAWFFNSRPETKANMQPIAEIRKQAYTTRDMVEVLWELYRTS